MGNEEFWALLLAIIWVGFGVGRLEKRVEYIYRTIKFGKDAD